jgi:hypothetical protein
MDKVQKRGFIKYNTPSSEPFRIELLRFIYVGCGRLTLGFDGPQLYQTLGSNYATLVKKDTGNKWRKSSNGTV